MSEFVLAVLHTCSMPGGVWGCVLCIVNPSLNRLQPSTLAVFAARSLERLRFLAESVSFAGDASPPPPASLSDMVVSYRYCRHPRVSKTKLACSPAKRGKGFPGDRASRLVAAPVAA